MAVSAATNGVQAPVLSVVSPVYDSARVVPEFVREVRSALATITADFEIILVEDGSPDDSWSAIVHECAQDARVKGVQLSRNFGQQSGITAGLLHARGRHVVVMDSDMQDDPRFIADLYRKALEGYDVVFARKRVRRYGFARNLVTRSFYVLFRWLASMDYDDNIGAYSILSRSVVDAFLQFGDYQRAYVVVLGWLGFRRTTVSVDHRERERGKSSYTPWRLFRQAITIMLTYSEKPLWLSIYLGIALSTLSFIVGVWLAARYFTSNVGQMALGWTSLVVSHLFLSGLILLSLGIVGIYVGRTFEQVKRRPIFVVRETVNLRV